MAYLKIVLTRGHRVAYIPGDILEGTIELHLRQVKKINGLYLAVKGRAKSSWSTGSSSNRHHHSGREDYIDKKVYMFSHERAIEMPIGVHHYDFAFQLPSTLPESMEARYGSIRYYLEACLDIPWSIDKEFKLDFKVVRVDDFNGIQELKIPRTVHEEIDTNTCFTASKPLYVTATIPYSVYTPGSTVPITLHLDNQGKFNVEQIQIRLKQYLNFHSYKPHKERYSSTDDMDTVSSSFIPGIAKLSSKTFVAVFKIPVNIHASSNNAYSKVIQVSYCLQVIVLGFKLKFPIKIARVPLRFDEPDSQEASAQADIQLPNGQQPENTPSFLTVSMPPVYQTPAGPSLESPPPTFEDAIKMPKFKTYSREQLPSAPTED